MKATVRNTGILGLLAPAPAAASGGGEFIDTAWVVFIGYCAIVIVPHAVRAVWILWKESRDTRRARRRPAGL